MKITFDHFHTALLAMDCQTGVVSVYAKAQDDFLMRAASVLRAARTRGMLVVQVRVGFRPGVPEVSSQNKLLGAIKSSKPHQEFFQGPSGAITQPSGRSPLTSY